MINAIFSAVSSALNATFGDTYEIYFSNDVEQGLTEPCFFISLVDSYRNRILGRRYRQNNSLDIEYFPLIQGGNAEMRDVAEQLFVALEYIELPDNVTVLGTAMKYQIIDSVLHFYVNYNLFLLAPDDEAENMETYELTAGITEGD